MSRVISPSNEGCGSLILLAALSFSALLSEAQDKDAAIPVEPPGWWAEEMGQQSQPLWDKLREDGKITPGELLELAYTGKSVEDGDAPALAARLLGRWREDPIPALQGMMADKDPLKRDNESGARSEMTSATAGEISTCIPGRAS